jgi:hypothetical protein
MNVGIRNEAAQFNFWEYINRIFGTVQSLSAADLYAMCFGGFMSLSWLPASPRQAGRQAGRVTSQSGINYRPGIPI